MYTNIVNVKRVQSHQTNALAEEVLVDQGSYASRIFTLIVATMVFANTYQSPLTSSIGFGEFLIIISLPFLVFSLKKLSVHFNAITSFCLYSISVSMLAGIVIEGALSDVSVRLLRDGFYYIVIFILSRQLINIDLLKKYIVRFCIVLAIFILVQTLLYYFFGKYVSGLIRFLPLNNSGYSFESIYDGNLSHAIRHGYLKPNGFLSEPSTCAHSLVIGLLILLFNKDCVAEKKKIRYAVLLTIAMAVTMSTSGFVYIGTVWLLWLLSGRVKRKAYKFFIVLFFAAIVVFMLNSSINDSISDVIARVTSIFSGGVTAETSASIRTLKGFSVYASLPLINKVFGIGFGSYSAAVKQGLVRISIFEASNEYMNSLSNLLVSSGIAGITLFAIYMLTLYRRGDKLQKNCVIVLSIMFLGASIYSSPSYVWIMLLILYGKAAKCSDGKSAKLYQIMCEEIQ